MLTLPQQIHKIMLIDLQSINVHLGEKHVLQDTCFEAEAGEYIYIIGRVGSGKSTLLRTIYADVAIESGTATVLDTDLTTIKRKNIPALRRQMGIVFQNFELLRDHTISGNLDFVLRATGWKQRQEREQRIAEVLSHVGLDQAAYAHLYPYQLSGGEQQRVCIARAILNSPKLILADEPTGNLDPEMTEQIMDILHNLSAEGTTVIMVTHNVGLIEKYPATVYECSEGRLILKSERHIPQAEQPTAE